MTIRARLGISALIALCLVFSAITFVVLSTPRMAVSSGAPNNYSDKLTDYGVCIGLDETKCYNSDWTPAFKRNEVPRVLVFSRTGGPRHAHLGPVL
ncbi:MAG TPA: hypothetical protein VFX60_05615, partial [Micromonospora sp.]|nr:hypothetical protein [Micromonospora sp.]